MLGGDDDLKRVACNAFQLGIGFVCLFIDVHGPHRLVHITGAHGAQLNELFRREVLERQWQSPQEIAAELPALLARLVDQAAALCESDGRPAQGVLGRPRAEDPERMH